MARTSRGPSAIAELLVLISPSAEMAFRFNAEYVMNYDDINYLVRIALTC